MYLRHGGVLLAMASIKTEAVEVRFASSPSGPDAECAGWANGSGLRTHVRSTQYAVRMRTRLTVSVDPETAKAAEAAVAAGRAPSVSAWVAEAMTGHAQRERLTDVLAEIRAEMGPATDEETAWARSVLGL